MKPDINSRKDIHFIITKFYDLLLKDDEMRPFFEEILANHQLEHHLEIITDFWNDILFDTQSYTNNVMQKHLDTNAIKAFNKEHFTRWISYFFKIIDENFDGKNAQSMKNRASSIATILQLKLNLYVK